jgi:hypothetical protein
MTTPIAAMVLEMIARGVDAEVIALAVSTAELVAASAERPQMSRDESVTHRRESDRLRKQRSRDRLVTSRDVTGQSQVPLSKSIDLEEKREAGQVEFRGAWCPPDVDWQDAISRLGEQVATSELTKFREIDRRASGAKKEGAWRVWVLRAVEYLATKKPANGVSVPLAPPVVDWDKTCAFFKRTGRWFYEAGPEPGMSGCRCPPEIIAKHGLRKEPADGRVEA